MTTNPIRQCIKTRYVSPTDTKPGRVKATCERGSITIDWMHEGNVGENHRAAVAALLSKFSTEDFAKYGEKSNGWGHMAEWRGGADKSEHVWVRVPGLGALVNAAMLLTEFAPQFREGMRGGEIMGIISNAMDAAEIALKEANA